MSVWRMERILIHFSMTQQTRISSVIKGHSESAEQMFRFEEVSELVRIVMDLLEQHYKENK